MTELLINSLLDPAAYNHETSNIRLLETHISWVILTGTYAYKIKKPVDFGFLDYSTLDRRHEFCELEIRYNRRLAKDLYLEVVPVTGTEASPAMDGPGTAIEYAVKMQQFEDGMLLSDLIDNAELREVHIDWLARVVARFHQQASRSDATAEFGTPDAAWQPVEENFRQIRGVLNEPDLLERLDAIESWSKQEFNSIRPVLEARKDEGFIRECHGDLHLGNIVMLNREIVPFDCIEFNDNLRWIDVMSEVAFLVMDIEDHGRDDFAWRLLNTYLEITGDYEGLPVLRYYLVYRAIVRAKVAALRLNQAGLDDESIAGIHQVFENYLAIAERHIAKQNTALIIMHGLSGSGKTTVSQQLLESLPAIRVRSDVERKRLHGLGINDESHSPLDGGIYDKDATQTTYARLADFAATVCRAGYPVIVDATFIHANQRQWFRDLAEELEVPFRIIACQASHSILRERIAEREILGTDASEAPVAVLERQLESYDFIDDSEKSDALIVNTTEVCSMKPLLDDLKELMGTHVDVFHD